ncbi:MAG: YgiQ family radical SAM protein [Clostridiales Family XIII bacterium]|nr:YgiQ family radical SAM protein [Clostridiales Family XIII bacterium]
MEALGWERPDFVLVTGDAYVDHPSFGHAIISRVLERRGYKVAILPQPGWRNPEDFRRFGKPRLGFLITSGNVDSMVNHYSVFKRRRRTDVYSPGGKTGRRPDRAVIVYSQRAREAYKDVPIILGGLEASLRRHAHYDYWEDRIRRSILLDSKADLLVYGMGERAVVEIAEALDGGIDVKHISWIPGTVYRKTVSMEELDAEFPGQAPVLLPSFEEVSRSKKAYADSFKIQYRNNDPVNGKILVEPYGNNNVVVTNPPMPPLESLDLDDICELPYERNWHPMYKVAGGVPAIEEVKFSITANRGCFGGCAFCALTYHQGREVRGRSKESVLREAKALTRMPDFKGYIHDIGGPTANFRSPACEKQLKYGVCKKKDCLYPKPCRQLVVDHKEYLDILRSVRGLPGVKKVFIRSGIRYDYVMADESGEFLEEICRHHVSGTLKVAPEHISLRVLARMRKPPKEVFEAFSKRYREINERIGKKQYLIPYLISSHPGSTLEDAVELALYLKKNGFVPDQVQDFYPTPGTLATCMYYTEMDPLTGEKVYVAKDVKEKRLQRALLHFHKKENRPLVKEALERIGRKDLIDVLR